MAAAARPALPLSAPAGAAAAAAARRSFHSAPVLRGLLDKKEAREVTDAKKKAVRTGNDERDRWMAMTQREERRRRCGRMGGCGCAS